MSAMSDDIKTLTSRLQPLPKAFLRNIGEMSARDVAFVVIDAMLNHKVPLPRLKEMVERWIDAEAPLREVDAHIMAYEPIYGDTLSEYDLMARYALLMAEYNSDKRAKCAIVHVASRDSGAAMGAAYRNLQVDAKLFVFQPSGELNEVEKNQLTREVLAEDLYFVKGNRQVTYRWVKKDISECELQDRVTMLETDDNTMAFVPARVFMYFDIYRQLMAREHEGAVIISYDPENVEEQAAVESARALGLPVEFKGSTTVDNIDEIVKETYNSSGYMLAHSSVELYETLSEKSEDSVGVFIQRHDPAKEYEYLEPLLNTVMMIPHKLKFHEPAGRHVRHALQIPATERAIKNVLTLNIV